jgi:hypothetical protein
MFNLFKNKEYKKCYICLDYCKNPCNLNLNCNCRYSVHNKCYKKWWDKNKNCIICLSECHEPYYGKSFINKRIYRIKTRLRIRYKNNLTNFSYYDIDNNDDLDLHYTLQNNNIQLDIICYLVIFIFIIIILLIIN